MNHLVYDSACGPCSRFKRIVDFLDRYNELDYFSLNQADALGLLDSIPKSRRHSSFHLISQEGIVRSGSEAIPLLVSLLPSGKLLSFPLGHSLGRKFSSIIYSIFSRLHDSGSCSYGNVTLAQSNKYGRESSEQRLILSRFKRKLLNFNISSRLF
jgi:predicted DCC family thiol-disulfide oxidoreductase YuxK